MELFIYILVMMIAILLSNIINRFLPSVPVPFIQIMLGAFIVMLPLNYHLEIHPELFFTLFVAPLVYLSGTTINKNTMWSLKKAILNTSVLLVLASVLLVGYLLHMMIPSISIAAAVILISALGPTDDIAVDSVGKRYSIPGKMLELLKGESVFNDVSSLILFQIGITTILTGSFSLIDSATSFILVGVGGAVVGACLSFLKIGIIKWIRYQGIKDETVYVLIGLITPFLVYYIAELLHVSGILAIFVAGMIYSFESKQDNPDVVNEKITSDNVWKVLSFVLEGIVFLILGTQIPEIMTSLLSGNNEMSIQVIIGYIVLIMAALFIIRFLWAMFTLPKDICTEEEKVSRLKSCFIFSLAGARGSVTLASVYSIPLVLSDGSVFPQRDLMIILAMGVILCSMILTYFVLPLLVDKRGTAEDDNKEVYLSMLNNVIKTLENEFLSTYKSEGEVVLRDYMKRYHELENSINTIKKNDDEIHKLMYQTFKWEIENVQKMIDTNEVSKDMGEYYIYVLNDRLNRTNRHKIYHIIGFLEQLRNLRVILKSRRFVDQEEVFKIMIQNDEYVIDKLNQLIEKEDSESLRYLKSKIEVSLAEKRGRNQYSQGRDKVQLNNDIVLQIRKRGLQLERDRIQKEYEQGTINWKSANTMRNNISLLEMQFEL